MRRRPSPSIPNIAVGTLDDALALWRGPALADLADQPSLLAEAARLDDLRLEAQEDRIEGLLASGAQARAIGELETPSARHPWRESLWGLLMLALYREGRQAEALRRLPAGQGDPGRRARDRPLPGAREAPRAGPAARSRTRSAGRAAPRLPAPGEDRRRTHGRRLPGDPTPRRARRGREGLPRGHRRRSGLRPALRSGGPSRRRPGASAHRPDLRLLAGARSCLHRLPVPARGEPSSLRGARGVAGAGPGPSRRRADRLGARVRAPAGVGARERADRPTSCSTPRATPTSGTSGSGSDRRRTPRRTSGSSPGSPRACCRTNAVASRSSPSESRLGTACTGADAFAAAARTALEPDGDRRSSTGGRAEPVQGPPGVHRGRRRATSSGGASSPGASSPG